MANRYYQGPPTDHFDGERFYHPGLTSSDKGLLDVLRWRLFGKHTSWPKTVPARSGVIPDTRVTGLRITLVGHASLLIQTAGHNLLLDPVWSARASPFRFIGPWRYNPAAIAFDDLPPIHTVLVTHNHYDHMDVQTLKRLWQTHRPIIVSPLGNDAVIRAQAPEVQVQTGDWWSSFNLAPRMRATIVPSYHWSSRSLRDRRMALWGGFVLETPAGVIYCAGDTAYRDGEIFARIRERFDSPLVAILPIGAYAPRWFMQTQHANPDEAVQIASDCGARVLLGVHWGTFALTDEPYNEPAEKLNALSKAGTSAECIALRPGDTWEQGD